MEPIYDVLSQQLAGRHVQMIAVSKTQPPSAIQALYDKGHRDFGENRVQEMREKYEVLPKDIRWHLIGHLQSNKVKYVAPWVHMIHSVDSPELLVEINRQAMKHRRTIPCLLQIFIAQEDSKFGFSGEELQEFLVSGHYLSLDHIRIAGFMGMATNTPDLDQVRNEFRYLHQLFLSVKKSYFAEHAYFRELSMGMSSDYTIAIEEGATMVRIGSMLFGARN